MTGGDHTPAATAESSGGPPVPITTGMDIRRAMAAGGLMGVLALVTLLGAAPDTSHAPQGVSPEEARAYYDSLLRLPDSLLLIPGAPAMMSPARIREFARRFLYAPESIYAGPDSAHLPDARMKAAFEAHERQFERLVRMFREDAGFDRIASPEFRTPNPPQRLAPARQRQYDRLLETLGVRVIVREAPDRFLLRTTTVWTFDRRGYLWSPRPPAPIVEHETLGCSECYRRLKGPWYVFFWSTS